MKGVRVPWVVVTAESRAGPGAASHTGRVRRYCRVFPSHAAYEAFERAEKPVGLRITGVWLGDPRDCAGASADDWEFAPDAVTVVGDGVWPPSS